MFDFLQMSRTKRYTVCMKNMTENYNGKVVFVQVKARDFNDAELLARDIVEPSADSMFYRYEVLWIRRDKKV